MTHEPISATSDTADTPSPATETSATSTSFDPTVQLSSSYAMKQLMQDMRAEVVANRDEIPFTATENEAIDAALAARAAHNATWASIIASAAAHAMPLKRGRKKPSNSGWTTAPAMNEATTAAHLDRDGNVGALLGASGERGWIAWDLDNELAARAVTEAGYRTATVPANSYNPNHSKGRFGGRHVIWAVPQEWGVDGMKLTSPKGTVTLANGGTADVLTGPKFIVLPPSVLCEEGVTNPYNPADGVWPGPVEPLPVEYWPDRWRPAGTPEPPPELAALRVDIRPKTQFESAEQRFLTEAQQELTAAVDAVPWPRWLALDPEQRIEMLHVRDSCGCNKLRYRDQSSSTGGVLHDGCPYGHGVHVYSGSLAALLASNGEHREHMSRLDLIVGVTGHDRRDVASRADVELHGRGERDELQGLTAADFEAMAADQEAKGSAATAASLREAAAKQRAAVLAWMEQNGETFLEHRPVTGAVPATPFQVTATPERPALHVIQGQAAPDFGNAAPVDGTAALKVVPAEDEPVTNPGSVRVAPAAGWVPPDPIPPGIGDDAPTVVVPSTGATLPDDPAGRAQAVKDRARAALRHSVEPELLDRLFCTSELKRIRKRAEDGLAPPVLALTADLAGILSMVPPETRIPPIVMNRQSGFNAIYSSVAESGGGKSGTASVSYNPKSGAPGLPDPYVPPALPLGSGPAMAELFVTMEKDKDTKERYPVVHNWQARIYWPEISRMESVKTASGSSLSSEMCQAFSSEELGSLTKTNCAYALPHTYRLIIAMGSQLATAGAALDPLSSMMGLSQRMWWVCGELFDVPEEGTEEFEAWARKMPDSMTSDDDGLVDLVIPKFRHGNVHVDEEVRVEVRRIRLRLQAAKRDPETALETHTALIRLRWAFAAAVYHGEEPGIYKKWWDWTSIFEEHHKRVRRACQIAAPLLRVGEAVQLGVADDIRTETRDALAHRNAKRNLLIWARAQHAEGKRFTASQAANSGKGKSYRRQHGVQLVQELVDDGLLGSEEVRDPRVDGVLLYHGPTQRGLDIDPDNVI